MEGRVLEHVDERLSGSFAHHASILFHGDNDDLLSTAHRDPLRSFGLRPPYDFAEAGFRFLEWPLSGERRGVLARSACLDSGHAD